MQAPCPSCIGRQPCQAKLRESMCVNDPAAGRRVLNLHRTAQAAEALISGQQVSAITIYG